MRTVAVKIDAKDISDWESFHSVFQNHLGFPHFYGRNMNAWIDCLFSIDDPDSGMTEVTVAEDEIAMLEISGIASFKERCREEYDALIECSAFVNYARVEVGKRPILSLMLID